MKDKKKANSYKKKYNFFKLMIKIIMFMARILRIRSFTRIIVTRIIGSLTRKKVTVSEPVIVNDKNTSS